MYTLFMCMAIYRLVVTATGNELASYDEICFDLI